MITKIVFSLLILSILGCATVTGPAVYKGEIYQAREELKVKALKYKLEKEEKVAQVGYNLLQAITERTGSHPYLGIRFIEIDNYVKNLFQLERFAGIAIAYVVPNGPGDKAGLCSGDILRAIGQYNVNNAWDLRRALQHIRPEQNLIFKVERKGIVYELPLKVGDVPIKVGFYMTDDQEVNAGVTSDRVVVTYGLMRFIKSEHELAIILGHELAHIVRGHIAKRMGTDLLSLIIGVAIGYGAESIFPGSGDIVLRGVGGAFSSSFSREFEREADYFGILYAHKAGYNIEAGIDVWERFAIEVPESMVRDFFSTHPTSPERLLRIKKIVQEIKTSNR